MEFQSENISRIRAKEKFGNEGRFLWNSYEINKILWNLRDFYAINLKQKMNKPKELWNTLTLEVWKTLGLPSKTVSTWNIFLLKGQK